MSKEHNYLLYIQLILILLLAYFGNISKVFSNPILAIIFSLGVVICALSSLRLGIKSFSPFPHPSETNIHARGGIYKYARHPLYSGLVLMGLALLLSNLRLETFAVLITLVLVLNIKADVEEEHLLRRHEGYKAYLKNTKKFIPFIY